MYALKNKKILKSAVALVICILTVAELTYNGTKVFESNYVDNKDDFINYTNEMEPVIENIKQMILLFTDLKKCKLSHRSRQNRCKQ